MRNDYPESMVVAAPLMACESNTRFGQAKKTQALLKDSQRLLDEQDTMLRLAESEPRLAESKRDEAQKRLQCKICLENLCELVMFPCNHVCACKSCFAGLERARAATARGNQSDFVACPTCRAPVRGTANTLLT